MIKYFDNAATSFKKPKCVEKAVLNALRSYTNPSRGLYDTALNSARLILETRELVADFFNANDLKGVVFTKNITEALNLLIINLLKPNDLVITSNAEHNAILRPLYQKNGIKIKFLPLDENGNIDFSHLDKNARLLIISHASNVSGNGIDLEKISSWCKECGVLLAIDSAQSAGELKINAKDIDFLCFTGHKSLLAPTGIGGIIFKDINMDINFFSGGTGFDTISHFMPKYLPERLEAGTLNLLGIAGLNASLKYIKEKGQANLYNKSMKLAKAFFDGIYDIRGVKIYGDLNEFKSGDFKLKVPIISLNIKDFNSSKVAKILYDKYGICTRAGLHCSPLIHEHFKTTNQGMVRFSFSHFNSLKEVNYAIKAIKDLI